MKSFGFIICILFCCHIWICFTYNEEKEQNSEQTLEQRFKDQNYGEVYLKRESNSLMKKNMSQYEKNKKISKANKLKCLRIKSKEFNTSGGEENENRNEDKSHVCFRKFVLNFGFLLLFIISSFVVSVANVMIGTQYFKSWFSLCFNFHSIFCFTLN
jgi:ATP-dependent Zn protease